MSCILRLTDNDYCLYSDRSCRNYDKSQTNNVSLEHLHLLHNFVRIPGQNCSTCCQCGILCLIHSDCCLSSHTCHRYCDKGQMNSVGLEHPHCLRRNLDRRINQSCSTCCLYGKLDLKGRSLKHSAGGSCRRSKVAERVNKR